MITSRYAEIIEPGKFVIKEENLTHGDDALLRRSHIAGYASAKTFIIMEDIRRGLEGVARGVFPMDQIITHRFPLDHIQTAFKTMLNASDGYVKGAAVP